MSVVLPDFTLEVLSDTPFARPFATTFFAAAGSENAPTGITQRCWEASAEAFFAAASFFCCCAMAACS